MAAVQDAWSFHNHPTVDVVCHYPTNPIPPNYILMILMFLTRNGRLCQYSADYLILSALIPRIAHSCFTTKNYLGHALLVAWFFSFSSLAEIISARRMIFPLVMPYSLGIFYFRVSSYMAFGACKWYVSVLMITVYYPNHSLNGSYISNELNRLKSNFNLIHFLCMFARSQDYSISWTWLWQH